MRGKILIIHMPVLHRGYLEFLENIKNKVAAIYIIDEKLQKRLSESNPDIAAIDSRKTKMILKMLGFKNIEILSFSKINNIKNEEIILVQDELSRNLYNTYLAKEKIEWVSVFLRWDKNKVLSESNLRNIKVSHRSFDMKTMEMACLEASKSGDWWRQVGAVLVKNQKVLICAYNQGLPSEYTPYQVGEVRDLFMPGERQDLAHTIHAEQKIIAQAAKEGIVLKNSSLYVSVFPCPVCAKLIACSGIRNLYFKTGGSNFDAKKVLDAAKVKIIRVS
ncbi:deaminase [Candidatus Parcubacteria bacterium]|nr:hypothetical protein [Patescibacteria group bacterium]MCG2688376.1 deaminase [Candidatus Parcubacteria bacterium]